VKQGHRTLKLAGVIVVVVGLAVMGYLALQKPMAPDVTFTTLEGKKLSMASMRGKVVWLNFWATSCPACIEEMPDLMKTYNKFRPRGFEVIAVAMMYDPPNYVLHYNEAAKLPFPVVIDSRGEIAKAFWDVSLTPTAVLVDKQGEVIKTIVGIPDFEEIDILLDEELRKNHT
jgi:peroxiredoxin